MASTADQLAKLGNDDQFRLRIQSLLIQQAGVVYSESSGTTNHAIRAGFAKNILSNPSGIAQSVAMVIASRPNLVAQATTFNFRTGHVETDATDAQIQSQISTDWDMLSGV